MIRRAGEVIIRVRGPYGGSVTKKNSRRKKVNKKSGGQ